MPLYPTFLRSVKDFLIYSFVKSTSIIHAVPKDPLRVYPFIILFFLVFLLIMPWHAINQRIPIWDSADFVLTAQKIIERMEGGLYESLKALYFERGWRPIIFPSLAVPGFLISSGEIQIGVGITQFFTVFILSCYVYLILRESLTSQKALVGTSFIVSLQWIINFSNVFYAELFWLAATAGTLFHFHRAIIKPENRHILLAGFWFGLMVALRPIETILLSIAPVLILIYIQFRQKKIGARDIGFYFVQLVIVCTAGWLMIYPEYNRSSAIFLILSLVVLCILWFKYFRSRELISILLFAQLFAVFWHLPTLRLLYLWAYETSFGSLAKLSDQKFLTIPPWEIVWNLLQNYSPNMLALVFFTGVIGSSSLLKNNKNSENYAAIKILLVSIVMMLPVVVMLSISGTSDMRRIMPAILVLYVGLTMLGLTGKGVFSKSRTILILAVTLLQTISVIGNGLNISIPLSVGAQNITGALRKPYLGVDPNTPVLDGVLSLGIQTGNISAYTFCYRDHVNCDKIGLPMFEPTALSILAKSRGLPIYVHFIGDLDFNKPDTLSKQVKIRNFQYILVDMFDEPANVNWNDPYVIHTSNFITMAKSHIPPGFKMRGCFSSLKRPICVLEIID